MVSVCGGAQPMGRAVIPALSTSIALCRARQKSLLSRWVTTLDPAGADLATPFRTQEGIAGR